MFFFRHFRLLFLILILPALVWLFYNQEANWHYTRLPNGMLIEHAHPYDKHNSSHSPVQNHSHTKSELLYLDIITHFFVLVITSLVLGQIIRTFTVFPIPLRRGTILLPKHLLVKNSRAPPSQVS